MLIPLILKLSPPESGDQHLDRITYTYKPAQIDISVLYDRPIQTHLLACLAHPLSQPIMASGKVANFSVAKPIRLAI